MKITYLLGAILCVFSIQSACAQKQEIENKQPNILLILADDLGWKDLSIYGNDFNQTPQIDRLAKQGMKFNQAYTAAAICSPTRASILTGQHPARLKITDWIPGYNFVHEELKIPDWNNTGLKSETLTIAELLKTKGYKTAWIGKWHLQGAPEHLDKQEQDHGVSALAKYHGFDFAEQDWSLNHDDRPTDPKGVMQITQQAMKFIDANQNNPWFVTVSHYAVHTPVRFNSAVARKYQNYQKSKNIKNNSHYAAMLEALDDSVGKLLKFIEDKKLTNDTMIVFYSDNGGLDRGNQKGPTVNTPLRSGKGSLYEGGIRVPLIIKWPGQIRPSSESEAMISSVDLLPTFAKAAGIDLKKISNTIDGIDISQIWQNDTLPQRESLHWHYPHYHYQGVPAAAVRKGNFKLIQFYANNRIELYNLVDDVSEKHDLSQSYPKIKDELLDNLHSWQKRVGAQMMTRNPNFNPEKAKFYP